MARTAVLPEANHVGRGFLPEAGAPFRFRYGRNAALTGIAMRL